MTSVETVAFRIGKIYVTNWYNTRRIPHCDEYNFGSNSSQDTFYQSLDFRKVFDFISLIVWTKKVGLTQYYKTSNAGSTQI